MNEDLEVAIDILEDSVRDEFEKIWRNITTEEIKEYEILVWGSTIDENKMATDLDVIFGYKETSIGDEMEESIEGWIKDAVYTSRFTSIDPLVTQYDNISSIVSRSRTSRLYRLSDDTWTEF
jgi:hypothetical protein